PSFASRRPPAIPRRSSPPAPRPSPTPERSRNRPRAADARARTASGRPSPTGISTPEPRLHRRLLNAARVSLEIVGPNGYPGGHERRTAGLLGSSGNVLLAALEGALRRGGRPPRAQGLAGARGADP